MKPLLTAALLSTAVLIAAPVQAGEVKVEITNVTNAVYFTPLLVAAHGRDDYLFRLGHQASDSLRAMAEGGDLTGLIGDLEADGAIYDANPAGGLLAPGQTATATLELHPGYNRYLSLVAMLLPTNDGFVGLDSKWIPRLPGRYTYYLNGYDAGTEDNNELLVGPAAGAPGVLGIPGDPTGLGGIDGTGVEAQDYNINVHIHPGIVGDDDPAGGDSDLDKRAHRWLNPVAKVVIEVPRRYRSY
jgi:hypothetical protein